LSGLEGTYAVALTAPALFTALLGRHPSAGRRPQWTKSRREPGTGADAC
jgi:hypothetical protein